MINVAFCRFAIWFGPVRFITRKLHLHTYIQEDLQTYSTVCFFHYHHGRHHATQFFLRSIVLSVKESFFGKCKGAKGDAADDKARKEKEGNKLLLDLVEILQKPGSLKARIATLRGGVVGDLVAFELLNM